MRHLLAVLTVRPAFWLLDLGVAFCLADHGQFWEMYRAQRAESRGTWCAYRMVRERRPAC